MSVASAGASIRFHAPWYDEREVEAIRAALATQTTGDGPFGRKVEARLSQMLDSRKVLLTTSCTHALELALLALGIGPGQEVITPSFTFVSSANAALRVGALPVFAEIDERTLGLDPQDVERRLTPRTVSPSSCSRRARPFLVWTSTSVSLTARKVSTSRRGSGEGLLPAPTNPVTPGVLRITYQESSSRKQRTSR